MAATQKPLVRKLTQVAIVVRDARATAKRYWDDLGIGPWHFYRLDPTNTPNMTLRGKPVSRAFIAAVTKIGDVALELIEPLEGDSLYAEQLAARGEGFHHIAFDVEDLEGARARLTKMGYREIQSGRTFGVGVYTYFDTDKDLGVITELGAWDEGKSLPPPESVYPPES